VEFIDGIHDMGGMHGFGPVVVPGSEKAYEEPWEARTFAMSTLVGIERIGRGSGRAIREEMDPEHYLHASYYERWLWSTEQRLLRKGTIAPGEVDAWAQRLRAGEAAPHRDDPAQAERDRDAISSISPLGEAGETRFSPGDRVRVRRLRHAGHTRCPRYVRGAVGEVTAVRGTGRARLQRLLRIRRRLRPGRGAGVDATPRPQRVVPGAGMSHDHDHDDVAVRAAALEALLVEKGLLSTDAIDAVVDLYENDVGPQNGARVVARAWVDDAYRERLSVNGTAAIAELGYGGFEGDTMVIVENTPGVHNVIVCTLCSCYPWPVLGLPPSWYKSPAYRARVVAEPRAVLAEFGLELDPEIEIRVWDSTAEVRYLVLPMRPAGTEAMEEDELAALVTRDSMVGTGLALEPAGAAR
jgi:nitrile hydratase subunit alpha